MAGRRISACRLLTLLGFLVRENWLVWTRKIVIEHKRSEMFCACNIAPIATKRIYLISIIYTRHQLKNVPECSQKNVNLVTGVTIWYTCLSVDSSTWKQHNEHGKKCSPLSNIDYTMRVKINWKHWWSSREKIYPPSTMLGIVRTREYFADWLGYIDHERDTGAHTTQSCGWRNWGSTHGFPTFLFHPTCRGKPATNDIIVS
jgi:hypothetical protein